MRPKKEEKKLSLTVQGIAFQIYEEEETRARRAFRMTFSVKRYMDSAVVKEYDVAMMGLSVWQLPHIPIAIKAHLVLDPKNGTHSFLRKDLKKLGEIMIGPTASKMRGSDYSFMLDQRVVRYGQSSGRKPFVSYTDYDTNKRTQVYESKATAMLEIIEAIRNIRLVGGHTKVNFAKLPDDVLEGIGFIKVPDIMGVGVPMWAGNPEELVKSGDWWDNLAREKSAANIESLLNIIQETIKTKAA